VPTPSLREQLRVAGATIEALQADNEQLHAENGALKTEVARLQEHNSTLADRVSALEEAARSDSTTTSKPPSRDGIDTRKKRAERRAAAKGAKRAQGKQPGTAGKHLRRRDPDAVVAHEPPCCKGCGADLAEAAVVGEVRRQVIDVPEVTATVTEHVAYRRRCACGTETVADMPPEAKAPVCWGPGVRALAVYLLCRQHLPVERTAELLGDVLGAPVSTGWLVGVQREAAGRLAPFIVWLKDRLGVAPVIHADETGTQIGTTKYLMHTIMTPTGSPGGPSLGWKEEP